MPLIPLTLMRGRNANEIVHYLHWREDQHEVGCKKWNALKWQTSSNDMLCHFHAHCPTTMNETNEKEYFPISDLRWNTHNNNDKKKMVYAYANDSSLDFFLFFFWNESKNGNFKIYAGCFCPPVFINLENFSIGLWPLAKY